MISHERQNRNYQVTHSLTVNLSQMILQNLGFLLHQCSKTKAYKNGISVHAAVIKKLSYSDVFLSNHLLNMYAKCRDITSALKLFNEMPNPNLVSWSAMISGCDQAHEHQMALTLFSQMEFYPNEYIYSSVISACAALSATLQGQQIHAHSLKSGCNSISFVSNSLISMYMKWGLCDDAFTVFSTANEADSVVTYNAMIMGFAENKQLKKGLDVFELMRERGVQSDIFTYMGVLGICAETEDIQSGIGLHCQTIKLGLDSTTFLGNVILTMYSKCNLIEEAENAFYSIEEKDAITWNTIITACSLCGDHANGLKCFRAMMDKKIGADNFTFASVLSSCAGMASIHHGGQLHAHIIRTRVDMDVVVGNALINMYAKCGNVGYASSVFKRMECRNLVSWNTMIVALGNHGLGRAALDTFEQMIEFHVKPDSITFTAVLTACNHAGLVDEGEACFTAMARVYEITPELEHFSCLIDLLGRAGRLEKAKEYMEMFPFGNDSVVLGSLLSTCRLHRNVVVGEWVACRIMELQPVISSPYVLLSNLYASGEKWNDVAEARKKLRGSGVKKEPGYSLIGVKGVVEKFTVGDFSHSNMEEMNDALRSLNWAMHGVCNFDVVKVL